MIERIIHQVWVGPHRMPSRERRLMEGVRTLNPNWNHILWTDANAPAMSGHVKHQYEWRMAQGDYAFAADVLRIHLLHEHGGVYLDIDTEAHAPLDALVPKCSGIFRHHGPEDLTLSNDFIGLKRGHALARFLLSTMAPPAYCFDPSWLGREVRAWMGMPGTADHGEMQQALRPHNIVYLNSAPAWYRVFTNHSLYSWSPKNRKRFEEGTYE